MPESEDQKEVSNTDLRNSQFGGGFINAENVNAGRIGGDIWNIGNLFFGQQATTPVGNPARPKNERLLLAAVKEEVTSRLRQSLHNAVLINLGKESQPQQVKRPWDAEIKIGLKPAEPLPETTTILEVFESEEIAGKLLILGVPGSGKTTTQLELAQALIRRAEEQPDYPVPVLFNLSSWKDDRQSLTDWLLAELKSKYGVSKKFGQEWVNNHQLLPLLDGLDELEPQRQELCVHVINQFLAGENRPLYLVVCSRSEEYSNYSAQLQLNGAIYLQPLTNSQICDYLTSKNYQELWSTISSDLDLQELVKTPLLLSITVLASQEISVEEWQHLNSTSDRIQYLLDAYIGRMLTREFASKAYLKNKPPNARQTQMWLVWLAQQMQKEAKTELLIEEMQPSYLKTNVHQLMYILIRVVIFGLIFGLIFGFGSLLLDGIFFGLIIEICKTRKIFDTFRFFKNLKLALNPFKISFSFGLISGLIRFFEMKTYVDKLDDSIYESLANSIFSGIIYGLTYKYFSSHIEEIKVIEKINLQWEKIKNWLLISIFYSVLVPNTLLNFKFYYCVPVVQSIRRNKEIEQREILTFVQTMKRGMVTIILLLFYGKSGFSLLILGLFLGLITGLFFGFDGQAVEAKKIPNQGIWKSAENSIIFGILFGIIIGIFTSLSEWLNYWVFTDLIQKDKETLINWCNSNKFSLNLVLKYGFSGLISIFDCMQIIRISAVSKSIIFYGLIAWVISGGEAIIQHFILRVILYFNGYIPWNYARFLNYCTERLFLQRVGGRYRFIHKLLQDHFAQMEFRKP